MKDTNVFILLEVRETCEIFRIQAQSVLSEQPLVRNNCFVEEKKDDWSEGSTLLGWAKCRLKFGRGEYEQPFN